MTPWTIVHQSPLSMDSPDKNIGVSCHFLLQGIFLTQVSIMGLLHCRQTLYWLSHQRRPGYHLRDREKLVFERLFVCMLEETNYHDTFPFLPISSQEQPAAAFVVSVPCLSCSATSIMFATLLQEMIILTGSPPQSPCQWVWNPWRARASSHSLVGETWVYRWHLLISS